MEQKKYRIVGSCNPYHARFHYNGYNEVLRYDGTTPVEWVVNDNYGYGFTLDEAMDKLDSYANEMNILSWEDNETVANLVYEARENDDIDLDTSWFIGDGWYADHILYYKRGDMYLEDDVMTYCIEEIR